MSRAFKSVTGCPSSPEYLVGNVTCASEEDTTYVRKSSTSML